MRSLLRRAPEPETQEPPPEPADTTSALQEEAGRLEALLLGYRGREARVVSERVEVESRLKELAAAGESASPERAELRGRRQDLDEELTGVRELLIPAAEKKLKATVDRLRSLQEEERRARAGAKALALVSEGQRLISGMFDNQAGAIEARLRLNQIFTALFEGTEFVDVDGPRLSQEVRPGGALWESARRDAIERVRGVLPRGALDLASFIFP